MHINEYLIHLSTRKATYVTQLGNTMINKKMLIILQESDIPRLCEMVRVLVETVERILECADDETEESLLSESILNYVQQMVDSDPFLPKPKKRKKRNG